MGTCNFQSMTNFDLWVVSGDRFYTKRCPGCEYHQEDDVCEICGENLTGDTGTEGHPVTHGGDDRDLILHHNIVRGQLLLDVSQYGVQVRSNRGGGDHQGHIVDAIGNELHGDIVPLQMFVFLYFS